MPRKTRKKSILDRKPPLHFTESPVNKQNNVPSPVLGALNPLSAQCRHIDEYTDVSWISPQFKNCNDDVQSRKRTCNKCLRSNRRGHSTLRDQENNSVHHGRRNKFKPLKFFGEITAPVSQIEDVNVTVDAHDDGDEVTHCKISTKSLNRDPGGERDDIQQFETFLQNNVGGIKNSRTSFTRLKPFPVSNELRQCSEIPTENKKNDYSLQESNSCVGIAENATLQSSEFLPNSSSTQKRRSLRIHKRYMESLNYLQMSTPPRQTSGHCKVLVSDTPESEYGLSVKDRQRMGYPSRVAP